MSKPPRKRCSKCLLDKTLDCFTRNRLSKDGLTLWCRGCHRRSRDLYLLARGRKPRKKRLITEHGRECTICEHFKTYDHFFINKNSGVCSSRCRECSKLQQRKSARKKGIKPRKNPFVSDGKKECLECGIVKPLEFFPKSLRGRLGRASYCLVCYPNISKRLPSYHDREAHRKSTAAYRKRHPERAKAKHRIHQFNRKRQIKAADDGTITDDILRCLYAKEICRYCKKFVERDKRTIDHLTPLSRGGKHSASNIDMACFTCNSSKRDRTEEEFIDFRKTDLGFDNTRRQ